MTANLKECFRCRDNGFPNTMVGFRKIGEDATGKALWKPVQSDGKDHIHKTKENPNPQPQPEQESNGESREDKIERLALAKIEALNNIAKAIDKFAEVMRNKP